uniref:Rubisco LSMT substrate-binding domain-containing protein n=1 Tax=Emiliania huxleyi TaxID=2903 RepID=A0A7S3SHK1_EMIHU
MRSCCRARFRLGRSCTSSPSSTSPTTPRALLPTCCAGPASHTLRPDLGRLSATGSPHACSIGVSGEGGAVSEAWQVEGKEAAAVLTAGAAAAAGEQVFIDYGEAGWRSSWEMLYTYGFVPGSSVEEWIAAGGRPLFFDGVSPSDELLPQKRALLAALGASEGAADGQWLDLKPTADQCVAMAPLLRLANLSPGDASLEEGVRRLAEALAEWRADPTALWSALQRPVGAAVEAKVAEQVPEIQPRYSRDHARSLEAEDRGATPPRLRCCPSARRRSPPSRPPTSSRRGRSPTKACLATGLPRRSARAAPRG